jgi:hypothetical protein
MSIKKMIKKYEQMIKDKFEIVYISQVLNDLRQCQRPKRED